MQRTPMRQHPCAANSFFAAAMIRCFDSKEGLYKAVLEQKLSEKAALIESTPGEDFTTGLINGFAMACDDTDALRMWLWEALDRSNRKLIAEEERRAYFQTEVARWRRAKASGLLSSDADAEMLLLVSAALRTFPLVMPAACQLRETRFAESLLDGVVRCVEGRHASLMHLGR